MSVDKDEIDFLKKIFNSLPQRYSYIVSQLDANIFIDKIVNQIDSSFFQIGLNSNADRVTSILKPYISLKGIQIRKKSSNAFVELQIGISEGVLNLYSLKGVDYRELDTSIIDVSGLKELRPGVEDKEVEEFIQLIGKEKFDKISNKLDINNIYKAEWDGKDYMVFSVDEDGLYCVDEQRKIYRCTYTPLSQKRVEI